MESMLASVKLFLLIMCIINVVKNFYLLAKVVYQKSGKFELSDNEQVMLAMSIAYIFTVIIMEL